MAAPYKAGGRIQPHREQVKAAKIQALEALNANIEPLPVEPPDWLEGEDARAAWSDLHPMLPHDVVRLCDAPLVAVVCRLFGRSDLSSGETATLVNCLDKLGRTPPGRRRLAAMMRAKTGDAAGVRFERFL